MTRKKKNAGFTLVEMVVTITIIAIIASLTVYGIFTWQDWARFNRQNEYAQTLFVAAQNQLSEYSANGKLKEMQDSLAGGSYESAKEGASEDELVFTSNGLNLTDQMGKIVSEEGNYDLKKLFPESDGKKDADGKDVSYLYRDEIVSLRAQAGDYASYLADPDAMKASNPEAYWLFELLGAYVYDSSILNGDENQTTAICLEITPEDGQVFSVLYSDRNRQFIYEGIQDGVAESEHVSSIANRTEEYRRERMIGYYGVDTLYVATKNKMSAPDIHRVMLVNKDSFYMEMLVPSAFAGLFQYEVDLDASKSITDKKLTLIVEGTKLKSKEKTTEPIKCQAYRYDSSKGKIDLGEFLVYAWLEKDASPAYTKVHIEYDAADIQATTYKYESDLDDIRSDIPQKSASTSFAQTRSFFRFGLDTSDVYATVVGKAAGYLDTKPASNFGNLNPLKNQNGKNPVFASIKITKTGDDADFKYTIINPRHLYNIRYIEDLPYEKEADGYKEIAKVNKVEFELKNDIDFGQFQAKGNLYYTDVKTDKINLSNLDGKIYALNDDAITEVTNTNCDFPSFKQLRVNDKFGGADGKNWIIKGIQTSEISNILYMVYNPVAPGNTKSADDLKEVLKPTGLFNVNYGEIKNLTMDDFSVRGSDMVGAFCGINAGVVTNLTSENTNKVSKVLGVKHVGGIMGIQLMTKQTNVIEKLNNKAGVYGTESVGGIVGMVRNDSSTKIFDYTKLSLSVDALNALNKDDNKTVLVRECKNNGPVLGTKKTDLKGVYNMSATGDSMGMPEDDPEKVRYIGGIVGYCYNKDTTKEKLSNITIDKCVSAPQYKADTLNEILGSKESLTEKLVGDYVGGIVGYNRYGTISNCEAKVEKDCPGYIFGYRYVGGIVGLNVGPLDGAKDSTTNGVNENNVIGCHYVGGIAGTNATLKEKAKKYNSDMTVETADPEVLSSDDAILEVATSKNLNLELSNWTNKGVVIATEEYAGGIAGYNTGWILGCTSEIIKSNVDSFYESLAKIIDLGNYCGGIAGYNNGIVGNTERNKTTGNKTGAAGEKLDSAVYVKGHNYVGGVVGYNDENAIVEDYAVIDGYVEGCENHFSDNAKSCFAGGYVGFNASPNLFMDLDEDTNTARRINASPETVHGDYFVGGAIGGNVINTMVYNEDAGDTPTPIGHDLLAEYKTDGFLGLLEGEEFVGGFIGYNLCFENDNKDGWVTADNDDADRGAVFALQTKLVDAFKTSDAANTYSEVALYQDKKAILDSLNEALLINTTASSSKFVVSGVAKDEDQTKNGTVSGQVYVGGVLGYSDAKTKLLLNNIENTNSIDAKQAIPYDREQLVLASNGLEERNTDYRGKSCAYTYSYAGGLIGKTWENAVVDGCKNNGMIRAKGTYTGALTEINEGTIQNCSVENFSPDKDSCIYYGGLCGLNKGLVTECEMNDKTITNDNVTVIGAIAAENFGIIKKITMKKPVIAPVDEAYEDVDGVTGLFAGYNGRTGQIEFADVAGALDLKNVKVQSNGRYVGALAGINDGILTNNKNTVVESDKSKNFILTGTVAGYGEVGGLVGYNRSQVSSSTIHNITVKPVTSESVDDVIFAKSGNVGSVFGKNDEKCKFLYCVNALTVKTTDGTAGGLIGENNNVINIENCKNEGKVETESGIAAGFVGEQKNSIFTVTGCENYGEIASTAKNGEDNAIAGFIGVISGIKGTGDSNTLIFITDSNNHGSVHIDRNNSTDYAGGFIGKAYRCSSIDISLYNCDETGIVSKLGSTTRDTKIGSFVGLGTGINLNFEMCQNYNVSKSANGYVGSGGTVSLLDCFDNSNVSYQSFKVTTNYPGNIPYGTNSVSYGKVSNNYVLNQNSNPSGDFIDFINKFGIVKNDRYTYLYERYNQKAFYYRKNAWDLIPANAFETRTNNPVSPTYYADISDYFESEKAGVDSRISVYKELHNIIEELIKGDYAVSGKLGETDNITLKEDEILDRIDVEWEAVKGAYKYELKYRYKNSENKDVESEVFTLGAGVTRYSIPISQEIRDKEIIFLVRAISVDGKHDGNWKESEPFFTKMPFSPLALHPEIVLHDDGDIALDSIKYDFTFDTLVDDEERADLGGYLITAKSLDNEAAGNKYLYVKEFNTKIKGNDIDLDIETLEESGTVEEIASENFAISGQERTVTIDCSEFKQGEKIEISVKAIPSTAAEKYRSGEEENAPFEMFNKLATPNIQMITVDDEASIAGIKSEEETWIEKQEYSKEIAIGITDAEQYADCPDVTAELAIAVYANREEVNSTNQMEEGSALWYSGAESVMYDKANPLSIGLLNDLVSGQTYQLNISQLENYTGQYAGKWLKIAYRVYSDKMIPSLYTDEDEEGVSVNYMWLHIPSIELADIDVTCSEAQNADIFAKEDITAMTKTIEFKENSDVDGYKIDIVSQEISVSENGIEARWPIAELRVEKHLANPADVQSADGTVDIYLTDETLYRGEEAGDIYKEDSEETYLGNMPLIDEQIMDIPELFAIYEEVFEDICDEPVMATAKLKYNRGPEDDCGVFTLQLPDIVGVNDISYEEREELFNTAKVMIEPYLYGRESAHCKLGKSVLWQRTKETEITDGEEETIYGSELIQLSNEADAVGKTEVTYWLESLVEFLKKF